MTLQLLQYNTKVYSYSYEQAQRLLGSSGVDAQKSTKGLLLKRRVRGVGNV